MFLTDLLMTRRRAGPWNLYAYRPRWAGGDRPRPPPQTGWRALGDLTAYLSAKPWRPMVRIGSGIVVLTRMSHSGGDMRQEYSVLLQSGRCTGINICV